MSKSINLQKRAVKGKPQYSKRAVKVNPQQVASYNARKTYKRDFKEISPDTDRLIDQMLNPEDCVETTRWPNTYALSSTYKSKSIFNAKFDATGRSCIAVAPTIKDSIFATYGAESSVTLNEMGASLNGNPYAFQQLVLDVPGETVPLQAPIICPNRQAVVPFPNAGSKRLMYPAGVSLGTIAAQHLGITFVLPATLVYQCRAIFYAYDANFQEVHQQGIDITSTARWTMDLGEIGVSPLNQMQYFSVEFIGRAVPYKGPAYTILHVMSGGLNGATFDLPNHAQHVAIYSINDADQISNNAAQAFVLSQSLLLTSEMSDINNGGQLAIARIPAGNPLGLTSAQNNENISTNNWYEWLASLPNNNYDGAVKNGGYAWYIPDDETGFFYRKVDNYFSKELPYLAAEFTVVPELAESSVVRIKIATIVQFTTTSTMYEQRPSCHVADIEFVHHLLSLVPAAYSNDNHREGLKKFLKLAGGKVRTLLRDPNTYATAAKILSTLAPLLL